MFGHHDNAVYSDIQWYDAHAYHVCNNVYCIILLMLLLAKIPPYWRIFGSVATELCSVLNILFKNPSIRD